MGMHNSVPAAPSDQVTIDRIGDRTGDHERCREAAPEEEVGEPGLHRPRDQEHDCVIDDFHDGDRNRVGRERHRDRAARAMPLLNSGSIVSE